ncbi:MAG TPA: TonB family protein [Steroidobacteraceae bacterium]
MKDSMVNISVSFRVLVGLAAAICMSTSAISQQIEPPPAAASSGSTHPRMDFKHPWHLDLPTKLMNHGQSGTCLVRFQVDTDGGIRAAQVVRSTGFPMLDLACLQNILHQTLLPATKQGERITEWVAWPISMNAKTPPANELKDTSGVPQIQQFFALKTNLADYPAVAREIHPYKDCRIRLWVTPEAKVEKLEVTQSTGIAELDQVCLSALGGAPFTAATRDGAAIGASAEVTMRWTVR